MFIRRASPLRAATVLLLIFSSLMAAGIADFGAVRRLRHSRLEGRRPVLKLGTVKAEAPRIWAPSIKGGAERPAPSRSIQMVAKNTGRPIDERAREGVSEEAASYYAAPDARPKSKRWLYARLENQTVMPQAWRSRRAVKR
jgi:hypothetical protein